MVSACSESSVLITDSTLAAISVAGVFDEVTAKLNPFLSNVKLVSLKGSEDKLITYLFLSTCSVSIPLYIFVKCRCL